MSWITDAVLMRSLPGPLRTTGIGLLGACVGGGFYVAQISNAASYLSDDPKACINCHIMEPMYATWQHSSHGQVATCNDCHVPHDSAVRKYFFKANDGLRHSALFTLRKEHQVIQAIPESKEVIQQNCRRCHEPMLAQVGNPHGGFDRSCIECHREVPHGSVHSLSAAPNAAVPPLKAVLPTWIVNSKGADKK